MQLEIYKVKFTLNLFFLGKLAKLKASEEGRQE